MSASADSQTTRDDRTLALDLAETLITAMETADLEIGDVTFSHRSVKLMAKALRRFAASSAAPCRRCGSLTIHRNGHGQSLCSACSVDMEAAS